MAKVGAYITPLPATAPLGRAGMDHLSCPCAILPLQWIYEQLNITVADNVKQLFDNILGSRWGYLALGILAPVAEELVFRGAILRCLLAYFNNRLPWIPIVVSALLFGPCTPIWPNLLMPLQWVCFWDGFIIARIA